jgi:hypothetical protein
MNRQNEDEEEQQERTLELSRRRQLSSQRFVRMIENSGRAAHNLNDGAWHLSPRLS